MANILKELQDIIKDKKSFKIGRIENSVNNVYTIISSSGGILKATGSGFYNGQMVLVEDNKIIGALNSSIEQVWID